MSMKNNIDKTEQLANNLKERVDSINQTITSNNGQSSKSLSDIPDNIKSMISKNYKKIAIVDMNMELKTTGRHDLDNATYIPLNLDFKPSIIIATASWREYNRVGSVCSTTTPVNTDAAGQLSDRYVGMKISGISKQGFTIRSWGEYALRLLEQVIAIE